MKPAQHLISMPYSAHASTVSSNQPPRRDMSNARSYIRAIAMHPPLVKELQNWYTDKAVQEFLLRGITLLSRCRPSGSWPSRGLPHFSFPCPQYTTTSPQNQRSARADSHDGWHRLRSRFNGGMAPQFTGRPLFKCYRKKNQRGNVLSLVLFCLSTGACWPHLYGCAGVTSRYGRPP